MNHTDHIALSYIDHMVPYINSKMLPLSQVVAQMAPDLAFTGNFYNENTHKPVCPLKADGTVYFADKQDNYYVHTWDEGPDITMALLPPGGSTGKRNHIANCVLIVDGTPQRTLYYNDDVAGVRGRVAMGTDPGYLDVFASSDGDSLAMTPEQLGDYAYAALHWKTGVMHDGGRKVNYYNKAAGIMMEGKDPSQNLILVYLKKDTGTKEGDSMDNVTQSYITKNRCYTNQVKCNKTKAMLHSTGTPGAKAAAFINSMNSAEASTSVEFVIDDTGTYQLLPLGIKSWHCGASANNTHVACEICEPIETRVLPVNWKTLGQKQDGNTVYAVTLLQKELQARGFDPKGIDGDFGPGTEAALIACQKSLGLTADGLCGVKTLAKLADRDGSFLAYPVKSVQPYFAAVYACAVTLFAQLMTELGGKPEEIVCHSEGYTLGIASNHADVMHWFPRHGKTMDDFRADVAAALTEPSALEKAVDKLAAAGIIDSPDYWKEGNYSAATVEKLLVKMAAAI